MEKHVTRQRLLSQRRLLNRADCQQISRQAQQQLIDADCFRHASSVALYNSVNNEVHTDQLFIEAKAQGKQVYFPRVCGEQLSFLQVESLHELRPGCFGVAEPVAGAECRIDDLDLIVVPGVAFDRHGFRLGYGKGFYDRELSRISVMAFSVGLCYEFQLCEALPVEEHDLPVSFIATDAQFISCDKVVAGSP